MGIFSNLKKAGNPNQGGLYFPPGDRFIVEVQRCKVQEARDGRKYFVVEAKVLHSLNKLLNIGQIPAWMPQIPGPDDMGLKNVNGFLSALLDMDIEKVSEKEAEEAGDYVISDDQPLAGVVCVVETHKITTKKTNRDFTVHRWSMPHDADYATAGVPKPKAA